VGPCFHVTSCTYFSTLPPFLAGWRRVGVRTSSPLSLVASLFILPSYRASFLLPFPSSMAMVLFLVAVLMVVTLVGLLLWIFFLRES
jgi:hypothetical protein